VRRPQVWRHDHLAELAADHRLAPVAEDALGRWVELAAGAVLVHHDHAVECHLDDGPGEGVAAACLMAGSGGHPAVPARVGTNM
jgi:hypothetical protein